MDHNNRYFQRHTLSLLRRCQKSVLYRWRHWKLSDYPLLRARTENRIRRLSSFFLPAKACEDLGGLTVKVFCQVKDDADIVEDWLLWHGHLFGFENLIVITDRPSIETIEVLRRYSDLVAVLQAPLGDWPSHLGWDEKRTHNINQAIQIYGGNADFVLPLDIDEFVIFEDKPCKQLVLRELGRLKREPRAGFKFGREFQSCTLDRPSRPAVDIRTFRNAHANFDHRKCFAKPQDLCWVGAGQCFVHTVDQQPPLASRLSLLHFRWRGLDHMYEKCVDHVSQKVMLPNGRSEVPRVGGHVLQGAQSIESGAFRAWAQKEVGEPTKTIHQLAAYLTTCDQGAHDILPR